MTISQVPNTEMAAMPNASSSLPISEAACAIVIHRALAEQGDNLSKTAHDPALVSRARQVALAIMQATIGLSPENADMVYNQLEIEAAQLREIAEISVSAEATMELIGHKDCAAATVASAFDPAAQMALYREELIVTRDQYAEEAPTPLGVYAAVVRDALLLQVEFGQPDARAEAQDLLRHNLA